MKLHSLGRLALVPAAVVGLALVVMVVAAPAAAAGGPSGSDVQMDGGARAMCAVTTTGAVHCWGDDSYHQAPDTVPGTFVQVSAGYSHACGLKTDQKIACWGANTYLDCDGGGGYCHEEYAGQANPPSVLSQQVSAGDYHTCSLQLDGYVDCWGMESDGSMDSIGPNSWVATAFWHTCAIRKGDSQAECWGDNATMGKMAQPPAGGKFTKLATGENHACGITPEGDVKCWGGNTWGQAPDFRPGPYMEIGAGDLFTCGLKKSEETGSGLKPSGEIDCWGYNFYGQTNAPDGLWTTLGVGDSFACASNTNTNVWQCWGWNLHGNAPRNKDLPQASAPETSPPIVQIVLTPPEPDGGAGWYRNPVKVDPQASDDTEIAELRCVLDPPYVPGSFDALSAEPCAYLGGKLVSGERAHTFYAAAKDPWGNVSPVVSASFKIDATPPKLICPIVQPFLLGSGPYQVGISVSDFGSGVDRANSTLFGHVATDTVGPKSATFTAFDFAGNSATQVCTYSVIYDFGGFYPPVKAEPALNTVQAGSAVPLKFGLGGDQGLKIFADGFPASMQVDCTSREPAGVGAATKTAGGSSLSYDTASGQYSYVWKTDKGWAGTCRILVLKLADDTWHVAGFRFR
jgi:hypothetical protein